MKKFLPIILLLLAINASSQNFLPFHKDRPAYYNFNSYDVFYTQAGIYIDSFKVVGSDTVFYHYPIIDYDNGNGCYLKAHDTSFVGDHSIRTANGDDEFFNRHGDTIFFKNNSAVNDSWTILKLSGGNKIVATVQSITLESILGVNDSVKKISLQAKDSLGNSISNIFNNKIFKIGKSFGLIRGYSLFHFPFDTIAFSIVGIENPSIGLSGENLTPEKIFDFEVGDEFDFTGYYTHQPTYWSEWCRVIKVLYKEILNDTLQYSVEKTYSVETLDWGNYSSFGTYDTIVENYVLADYNFLTEKPFQYSINNIGYGGGGYTYLVKSEYSSGSTLKLFHDAQLLLINDDCLGELAASFYPNEKFPQGLGFSYFYDYDGTDYWYDTLAYYNKDSVEWGTPINCPVWTGIGESASANNLHLFPNPTHAQLFLSGNFSTSQTHFTLLNSLGEEMKLTQLSNQFGSISFDVHSLPPGLYVLQVKKEDEVVNLKFVKN